MAAALNCRNVHSDARWGTGLNRQNLKQNRSLSRGLRILRVFNEESRPTLAQIAAKVDLDKTTCRRFLLTLQEEGYVEYDADLKRYQLRPLVLELGYAALGSMSVPKVAQPYMQDLANQSGGAANLSTLDGDEIVLVGRAVADAEKRKLVTMNLHVGMRLPAFCTAMGRVLIGLTHDNLREFVASMRIDKVVARTVTGRAELTRTIDEARRQGYAVVVDQLSIGHGAIAVPLKAADGGQFALAVSVSTGDYTAARLVGEVLPALRETQARLHRVLMMSP